MCVLPVLKHVFDVDDASLGDRTPHRRSAPELRLMSVSVGAEARGKSESSGIPEAAVYQAFQATLVGAAQPNRRLVQGVEHGLQVEGRTADDLEHVGRRCLLLQRLLKLGEETHVLDRDHRLVGEGLDQLDLPCRERLHLRARQDKHADGLTLAQQGHPETGSIVAMLLVAERIVVGVCEDIGYVDRLAAECDPSRRAARVHRERMGTSIVLELRRKAMARSHMIEFPATLENQPVFGFTCPCCGFDQGVEHRLQIER